MVPGNDVCVSELCRIAYGFNKIRVTDAICLVVQHTGRWDNRSNYIGKVQCHRYLAQNPDQLCDEKNPVRGYWHRCCAFGQSLGANHVTAARQELHTYRCSSGVASEDMYIILYTSKTYISIYVYTCIHIYMYTSSDTSAPYFRHSDCTTSRTASQSRFKITK